MLLFLSSEIDITTMEPQASVLFSQGVVMYFGDAVLKKKNEYVRLFHILSFSSSSRTHSSLFLSYYDHLSYSAG